MESEVYKQTLAALVGERTHCDFTDEEDSCNPGQLDDTFDVYRNDDAGHHSYSRNDRRQISYSSDTTEVSGRTCTNPSGRAGDGRILEVHHRLRWADHCKKELTREHPRKRYVKRATQPPPLKSILKGT